MHRTLDSVPSSHPLKTEIFKAVCSKPQGNCKGTFGAWKLKADVMWGRFQRQDVN